MEWQDRPRDAVPDVSEFLDLATTALEITDWNERRQSDGLIRRPLDHPYPARAGKSMP